MCGRQKDMLPIGIENFKEIRTEGYYYVDKTGLIRDLLTRRSKVNLFTRPRRFGKSLNMSMLQSFFEYGGEKTLFDGLEISKEPDLCEKYMGKYPVISVSLKSVNGADYETARALMCSVIGEEALRFYDSLDGSERLNEAEKERYRQLIDIDRKGNEGFAMPDAVLMGSLRLLSALLEKHFGEKVIILIDEYDVPLAKAEEKGYYNEMVLLIRNIFEQALKTNNSLYFAVLTGCMRVSRESIFTGLNNLKVLSVTSVRFDEYFGFTDQEVRRMLEYYGLSGKYDTVKQWYDGYRFGNVDVYCPWDVISYCDELTDDPSAGPKDYWSNTSSNDVVRRLLEKSTAAMRDDIERLISGESVPKEVNEELTYNDLYSRAENVWSVLFTTGYLTQRGKADGEFRRLAIPNREIQNIFMNQIREWMQAKVREDGARLQEFCEALKNADTGSVQSIFTGFLGETISIRDTAVKNELKENFYHGFLLGLLRSRENWKVVSNRESGTGFADITVEIFAEKTGIVIELKYPEKGNLDAGCRKAMEQIEAKNYAEQLRNDGMQKIIKCGIACYGKECKVMFEEEIPQR